MSDHRPDARVEDLVSALAAGELAAAEAERVRAQLARDPQLARLYGEIRAVRRGLADTAATAESPPPGLRDRILTATLPPFRTLYQRRTSYWPTWLAAAAAAAAMLFFQPPLVRGALDSLPRASDGVSNLRAAANRQADRALALLGVLRASVSFALEDRMDQLGDRLQDLERATRHRAELSPAPARGPDPAAVETPQGGIAP